MLHLSVKITVYAGVCSNNLFMPCHMHICCFYLQLRHIILCLLVVGALYYQVSYSLASFNFLQSLPNEAFTYLPV